MLGGAKKNMQAIGKGEDYFEGKQLSADCNYHNKDNLARCEDEGIDAYIPDPQFRKRDVRFAEQDRFKDGINPRKRPKKETVARSDKFTVNDFTYDEQNKSYICPNKNVLKRTGGQADLDSMQTAPPCATRLQAVAKAHFINMGV